MPPASQILTTHIVSARRLKELSSQAQALNGSCIRMNEETIDCNVSIYRSSIGTVAVLLKVASRSITTTSSSAELVNILSSGIAGLSMAKASPRSYDLKLIATP